MLLSIHLMLSHTHPSSKTAPNRTNKVVTSKRIANCWHTKYTGRKLKSLDGHFEFTEQYSSMTVCVREGEREGRGRETD